MAGADWTDHWFDLSSGREVNEPIEFNGFNFSFTKSQLNVRRATGQVLLTVNNGNLTFSDVRICAEDETQIDDLAYPAIFVIISGYYREDNGKGFAGVSGYVTRIGKLEAAHFDHLYEMAVRQGFNPATQLFLPERR